MFILKEAIPGYLLPLESVNQNPTQMPGTSDSCLSWCVLAMGGYQRLSSAPWCYNVPQPLLFGTIFLNRSTLLILPNNVLSL